MPRMLNYLRRLIIYYDEAGAMTSKHEDSTVINYTKTTVEVTIKSYDGKSHLIKTEKREEDWDDSICAVSIMYPCKK